MKAPTIHQRKDRNLFYIYHHGKKVYLGGDVDDVLENYRNIIGKLPQHFPNITPQSPKIYPIITQTFTHNSPNNPHNSVDYLFGEYIKYFENRPGNHKSDLNHIKKTRSIINLLFPSVSVSEFKTIHMRGIRDYLLEQTYKRNGKEVHYTVRYTNKLLNVVRACFRYGAENDLCDENDVARIKIMRSIRKGETKLNDTGYPHRVIDEDIFRTVLDYLTLDIYRDILKLLWTSGCRPSELLSIRGDCVTEHKDKDGRTMWVYQPKSHKTMNRGKKRVICFNEEEQKILMKYKDGEGYWLTPRKAILERMETRKRNRVSPIYGKELERTRNAYKGTRLGKALEFIQVNTLAHRLKDAIKSAIKDNAIEEKDTFDLYSIRHSAISRWSKTMGIQVASALCGHSCITTTSTYYDHSAVDLVMNSCFLR